MNEVENIFKNTMILNGFSVKKSSKEEDMFKHFDFIVSNNYEILKVDVKAERKINRRDNKTQSKYTWIELKNVNGKRGWIFGEANIIAFQVKDEFWLIKTRDIRVLLKNKLKFKKSNIAKDSLYKIYSRKDRHDWITLVDLGDLKDKIYYRFKIE